MSQCVVRFAHQYRTVGVPQRGIARRVDERGDAPGPLSAGHHELDRAGMSGQVVQDVAPHVHGGDVQIGVAAPPFGKAALPRILDVPVHPGRGQDPHRRMTTPRCRQTALQHRAAGGVVVDLDDHRAFAGTVRAVLGFPDAGMQNFRLFSSEMRLRLKKYHFQHLKEVLGS